MISEKYKELVHDPTWFTEHFFKIRTKDKKIIPFLKGILTGKENADQSPNEQK